MLQATFSAFKGLSPQSEITLWQRGIFSWKEFMASSQRIPLSQEKTKSIEKQIDEAQAALCADQFDWFINRLTAAHFPRIYPHCHNGIRYIDIETTGCSPASEITTIAVYDGVSLHLFTKGINLHCFPEVLSGAKILVTFNGARFDLPFLRRRFGLNLMLPHIDLLKVGRAYGYTGGLKACEKKMGIDRGELDGTDGKDAVELWRSYSEKGNKNGLKKLLAYNSMDVLSLETLLIRFYNESMYPWPLFKKHPHPKQPDPFKASQLFFDN